MKICIERQINSAELRFGFSSSWLTKHSFLSVVATASSLPSPIAKMPIRNVIIIGNTEIFITSEVLIKWNGFMLKVIQKPNK